MNQQLAQVDARSEAELSLPAGRIYIYREGLASDPLLAPEFLLYLWSEPHQFFYYP